MHSFFKTKRAYRALWRYISICCSTCWKKIKNLNISITSDIDSFGWIYEYTADVLTLFHSPILDLTGSNEHTDSPSAGPEFLPTLPCLRCFGRQLKSNHC